MRLTANPHPSYIEISEDEELQQDQDAEMQNNGDRDNENHYDEDEELEEFEEEQEEVEEEDEEEDFIDADYAAYLTELLRSSFGHHAGGISGETESRDGAEKGGEKRRRIRGPGTLSLGGIGSAEGSQGNEWNRSGIDGLFCPICLDAWTNDGDHRICVEIRERFPFFQCPQCNQICKLKDVRKLFVSQVLSVDEESQKRIRVLEDKCASLEEKVADLSKKEAEWLKREGELQQKVQQCTEFILGHLLMTFTDEMLTNKNDYRAGLVKGHIMTSALGLNSGQQILELGSRWFVTSRLLLLRHQRRSCGNWRRS
ncbi:Transducin/WD40 repeat-like superfamily protein [Prunus dulcis]|uniref:Transducin/WD40 repeat-like superfamily protein n=1 Tax=Prunus dulcis TaxID=3755 RepID=A0A4Y1RVH4_PRUDU|nr:Transducin/WD40 repeat-like superfamily protein [Prunus dulcis]